MPKTSISFRVPPSLWGAFKQQTDRLFLTRAQFLDHMIGIELPHLRNELEGIKLPSRTKRYISGRLKYQSPVSVNIEVRAETADALRDAVDAHNIVRDAFMCRLVIFLRCTKGLRDLLDIPDSIGDQASPSGLQSMPTSPLLAMEAVRDDPLFYVREHLLHTHGQGIYMVDLPKELDWAACHLPGERVPGTGAFNKATAQSKKLQKLLDLLPDATDVRRKREQK